MSIPQPNAPFNIDKFIVAFTQAILVQGNSKRTAKAYCDAVILLYKFNHIHPFYNTVNHIRAFFYHLLYERKYATRTYNQIRCGLIAFYKTFLPDVPIMDQFHRHKTNKRLVPMLTDSLVNDLIDATCNIKHRAMIELLYGTGVRVGECANLKISSIDSKEMLIHVEGKGEKDRYVMLPQHLLITLREYVLACKPKTWLFEGRNNKPISTTMIEYVVRKAAKQAGITKKVTPHILRHTFATHLCEAGYDITTVQKLLGHKHIRTTARYLHARREFIKTVTSPLDRLYCDRKDEGGNNA